MILFNKTNIESVYFNGNKVTVIRINGNEAWRESNSKTNVLIKTDKTKERK